MTKDDLYKLSKDEFINLYFEDVGLLTSENLAMKKEISRLKNENARTIKTFSLNAELTESDIKDIWDNSINVFSASFEQWKGLFADPLEIKKPIKLGNKTTLSMLVYFIKSLKDVDLISTQSYWKGLESSKAFSLKGKVITQEQYKQAQKRVKQINTNDKETIDKIILEIT